VLKFFVWIVTINDWFSITYSYFM